MKSVDPVLIYRDCPAAVTAAGAAIDRPLEDQHYGSRHYTARDPEGNLWSFGTYRPNV